MEISQNILETSHGLNEVSANILGVRDAAEDTARGVATIKDSATGLDKSSSDLLELVGKFKV